MGLLSRRKGARIDFREIVKQLLNEAGVQAELSGSGDLIVDGQYRAEVKARGKGGGFALLDGKNDLLFWGRDGQQPLLVMDMALFIELMTMATMSDPPQLTPNSIHPN